MNVSNQLRLNAKHEPEPIHTTGGDGNLILKMPSRVKTSVPEPELPAHRCPYCSRPFPTSERLALHKGLQHHEDLEDAEQDAFEDAYITEEDELQTYRLKALGALILVYFGFLMIYALEI